MSGQGASDDELAAAEPHYHIQLNRCAEWKLSGAGCGAGVAAGVAVQRDEKVRRAVDHARLFRECRGRANEPTQLFDRYDHIEVADVLLDDGQQVEHRVAGRDLRITHGELGAHLAAPLTYPARYEEQVA